MGCNTSKDAVKAVEAAVNAAKDEAESIKQSIEENLFEGKNQPFLYSHHVYFHRLSFIFNLNMAQHTVK